MGDFSADYLILPVATACVFVAVWFAVSLRQRNTHRTWLKAQAQRDRLPRS